MVASVSALTTENAWNKALQAARQVNMANRRAEFLLTIWRATREASVLEELRDAARYLDSFGGIGVRTQIALETGDPQDFKAAQDATQKSDQYRALTAEKFAAMSRTEEARILVSEISDPYWLTFVLNAIANKTRRQDDFAAVLTAVQRITGFNDNIGLSCKDMELRSIVTEWVKLGELNAAAEAAKLISHPGPRAEAFISIAQALATR